MHEPPLRPGRGRRRLRRQAGRPDGVRLNGDQVGDLGWERGERVESVSEQQQQVKSGSAG